MVDWLRYGFFHYSVVSLYCNLGILTTCFLVKSYEVFHDFAFFNATTCYRRVLLHERDVQDVAGKYLNLGRFSVNRFTFYWCLQRWYKGFADNNWLMIVASRSKAYQTM